MINKPQYYYRRDGCPANNPMDSSCICWHDQGTGPFKDERYDAENSTFEWRVVPGSNNGIIYKFPEELTVGELAELLSLFPNDHSVRFGNSDMPSNAIYHNIEAGYISIDSIEGDEDVV